MCAEPAGVRTLLRLRTSTPDGLQMVAGSADGDASEEPRPDSAPPTARRNLNLQERLPAEPPSPPPQSARALDYSARALKQVEDENAAEHKRFVNVLDGLRSWGNERQQEREALLRRLEAEYGFALPEAGAGDVIGPRSSTGSAATMEFCSINAAEADAVIARTDRDLAEVRRRRESLEERTTLSARGDAPGRVPPIPVPQKDERRVCTLRAEVARLKAADQALQETPRLEDPLYLEPPDTSRIDAVLDMGDWLRQVQNLEDESMRPLHAFSVASPVRSGAASKGFVPGVSPSASADKDFTQSLDIERHLDEILGEFDEIERIAKDLGCAVPMGDEL